MNIISAFILAITLFISNANSILLLAQSLGQEESSIDLKKQNIRSADDSLKVQLYLEVARFYRNNHPELYKAYLDSAEILAVAFDNPTCLGDAYHERALYLSNVGNFDDAKTYNFKALEIRQKNKDEKGVFKLNSNLGVLFVRTGKYDLATEYFFKALDYAEKQNDAEAIASCMGYLGHLNYYQKNFKDALKYHKLSKDRQLEIGNNRDAAVADLNIGIAYSQLNMFDSALYHYELSLDSMIVFNDEAAQSRCYNNIGMLYNELGEYNKGIDYLERGLAIRIKFKDTTGIAFGYRTIAFASIKLKQYDKAINLLEKSVALSEKMDFVELMKSSFLDLSTAYEAKNDFKKSLEYHKKALSISDTVLTRQKIEALKASQVKYETEKKEQENALLKATTALKDLEVARAQSMLLFTIILVILLAIVGYLIFNRMRLRARAQLLEQKENDQRLRFGAVIQAEEKERKRIAQELHDGIGQQLGGLKIRLQNMEENIVESSLKSNLMHLKGIVDETASDVRTISHQMMPRALSEVGLAPAMRDVLENSLAVGGITYQFDNLAEEARYSEQVEISIYRILQELINNINKHSQATHVSVQLIKLAKRLILIVQDNGKGMNGDGSGGHGIGNIKQRAEILGGSVLFEEGKEGGVVCTVSIPIS